MISTDSTFICWSFKAPVSNALTECARCDLKEFRKENLIKGQCCKCSTVVKVLCYKSEGRWFDPSWCHWNFSLT